MAKKNETAIQKEQQFNTTIINNIIEMFADQNISIEQANKILYDVSKQINQQTVRFSR